MPIIESQGYYPDILFRNGHLNTIITNLFRKVNDLNYDRKRIYTPDNDFLDLDFSKVDSDVLVIVLHGLEGSSKSLYIKGVIKAFNKTGWDAVAVNLRSCSGEPNLLFSSYHSGKTDDVDIVLDYISANCHYKKILMMGFSLGGNIVLKYAGEKAQNVAPIIKGFAGVSVPCDLTSASENLGKISNRIYLLRFLKTLKKKVRQKKDKFPQSTLTIAAIENIKNFLDFDNLYTAPAHGFDDAFDYWEKCSCKKFLNTICIPSYLINALDDPFLTNSCFPFEEANKNSNFYFEAPKYGGHVGFKEKMTSSSEFWHEKKIIAFFKKCLL